MSQVFYTVFDPNEIVQDTMEQLIEDSLDALRTNWEGGTSPPTPKTSQFFSNSTSNRLQIRAQDDSGWEDVYDFTNQEVVLGTGQVETVHISDTARKGSLVQDEAISPATCAIQAKFSTISLFGVPSEFYPLFTTPTSTSGVGVLTSTSSTDLLTSKIYVPEDVGTLYMMCYQVTCNVNFVVSALASGPTGDVTGPAWGPVVNRDLSVLSAGWYDIKVQATSSVGSSPFGGIGGVSFRWEV